MLTRRQTLADHSKITSDHKLPNLNVREPLVGVLERSLRVSPSLRCICLQSLDSGDHRVNADGTITLRQQPGTLKD